MYDLKCISTPAFFAAVFRENPRYCYRLGVVVDVDVVGVVVQKF